MFKANSFTITIVSLLLLTFIVQGNINAQAKNFSQMENVNLRGGVSYIELNEKVFNNDEIDLKSGFGLYIGGEYNIKEKINLVGQYERYFMSDSWTDDQSGNTIEYNINLNSLVGLFSYNFMPINTTNVSLLGGPGYYFGEISTSVKEIDYDVIADFKSSIGYKLGAEVEHRLKKNLNLNANGFYRDLEMEIAGQDYETDKIDFSGFEFSVGLNYKF